MASLAERLKAFVRTPQGQRMVARAQQEIAKPANQQRLRQLSERLRARRRR